MARNRFHSAINNQSNLTQTENLGKAYVSTLNPHLDYFLKAGIPNPEITRYFYNSFMDNKETALRILVWSRDILHGAGLRKNFMEIVPFIHKRGSIHDITMLLDPIVKLGIGSWKDVLKLFPLLNYDINIANMINFNLGHQDRLLHKWMPRKGPVFNHIRKGLNFSPKTFRQMLVANTDVVEQKVCAKHFDEIIYSQVPSKAFKRHTKAFKKHDTARFEQFTKKVLKGEEKVKAGAIYPHEVLHSLQVDKEAAEAQWMNLPRTDVQENLYLPILDCSGSMETKVLGSYMAIDIAHALGIYFSEQNKGVLKDQVIIFSHSTKFLKLNGTLYDKWTELRMESEVADTNLKAVFDKLLTICIDNNVTQDELPKFLLIISDGQWNAMTENSGLTVFEYAEKAFKTIGLRVPHVLFWNVSNYQNQPFTIKNRFVVTVSGPSPSVLKGIMTGKTDAIDIMNEVIMIPRYDFVKVLS